MSKNSVSSSKVSLVFLSDKFQRMALCYVFVSCLKSLSLQAMGLRKDVSSSFYGTSRLASEHTSSFLIVPLSISTFLLGIGGRYGTISPSLRKKDHGNSMINGVLNLLQCDQLPPKKYIII